MATSLVDSDSLLVIDVGSMTTRAILFDVVETQYRFIASGESQTTAAAPFHHIGEGVRLALERLQKITGRRIVGENEELIIPSGADGSGVDACAATISAGKPLRVALVGLLDNVSLKSAQRLAETANCQVVQSIHLADRRKADSRIDAILNAQPDLILIAGGTDNGASRAVLRLLESVGLACFLMPAEQRPPILFVGNRALQKDVRELIGDMTEIAFGPNVRPALEVEHVEAAQPYLASLVTHIQSSQISGVSELNNWTDGQILPALSAFGRVIRFLSKTHSDDKGVVGVDVEVGSTSVAMAKSGQLEMRAYHDLGLGNPHIASPFIQEMAGWLGEEHSFNQIQEYLYTRAIYPQFIPYSKEELALEQALLRILLRRAIERFLHASSIWKDGAGSAHLPLAEPIIVSGRFPLADAQLPGLLLSLLDGLQPVGVTTLVLDSKKILPALGVAASINPVLSVQVLNSTAFQHLGTIVAPKGKARIGAPALRVKLQYENGREIKHEIKFGTLEALPLPQGEPAKMQLQPLNRLDIGMGAPGRGGTLRVVGGLFGVIVDTRSRPIILPKDKQKRMERFQQWLTNLGGK